MTYRFWLLLGFGIILGIPVLWAPELIWVPLIFDFFLFALVLADRLMMPRLSPFEFIREHEPVLSLGSNNPIKIKVTNRLNRSVSVDVRDEPPIQFEWDNREFSCVFAPYEERTFTYHVTMTARGDYQFRDGFVRCPTPLGLSYAHYRIPASETVKVYPNILALKQFDLLRHKGRLREMGIRRSRIRGIGSEFESLRDYTPDDELRKVDWKATARRRKVTVRNYEVERSQSVFLVVDLGRNMMAEVENIVKLDHVINSALMLSYSAVTAGDKLGLLTFNDGIDQYISPNRGQKQIETILDALHGVQPEPVEPNYNLAFAYLSRRWRRRSLVIIFTDLQEPETSSGLINALGVLTKTHLCICVTVADPRLGKLLTDPMNEPAEVYTRAVALQVEHDRKSAIHLLRQKGVHVVESEPERLSQDLVNYYINLKSRSAI